MGAHHPQYQLERRADQQADHQYPQGRGGLVRHHAVVGLHHEQRHHQAQQVDQQTGENCIAVQPARQLQGVAKPRLDSWHQRRAQVFDFVPWPGKQGLAAVGRVELFAADPLFAAFGFAGQDQRLAILAPAPQHRAAAFVEQQQHWQVQRRDGLQVPAQYPRLQAGPGRGPWQQVQAQALLRQGQAGAQAATADAAAVQLAEDQQAVEQRVIKALARVDTRVQRFHLAHGDLLHVVGYFRSGRWASLLTSDWAMASAGTTTRSLFSNSPILASTRYMENSSV